MIVALGLRLELACQRPALLQRAERAAEPAPQVVVEACAAQHPGRTVEDKIDGVVITFVDVSDRRQVEEQLRESERQLRQLKGE